MIRLLRALLAERRRTNELLERIANNTAKPAPVVMPITPSIRPYPGWLSPYVWTSVSGTSTTHTNGSTS